MDSRPKNADGRCADERCVVGVDFGSLSGRAVVVRAGDGMVVGSAEYVYPHGVMDRALSAGPAAEAGRARILPPDFALQVPSDYIGVLSHAVPAALAEAGVAAGDVIGIGTDFTACTMIPVLADGTPVCELPAFADEPHAYAKLWKHHAAQPQADRINALAEERGEAWLGRYGGRISSEWEFAKGLELLEEAPEVYRQTDRWVEAADWIVWRLCGTYVRNACATGYKAIYQDGAYPSREFLAALDSGFESFVADKIAQPVGRLGARAGGLSVEAAGWTGLQVGTPVAVGNVDAHVTAPAADAVEPGQMTAIMGTSTCHVINNDHLAEVPGMCGVVDGGIVDGLWGYEAGQSGVGDIFSWFVGNALPASYTQEARKRGLSSFAYLGELAGRQRVGEHGLVALDWWSGNRSVLVDHRLSGLIVGLTLQTRPEDIYRALVEATAFGTRVIVEAFSGHGIPVTEFVAAGGLIKDRFLMQIYSDVLRLPISTIGSTQGPALGSAIHAAVAAGAYPTVREAAAVMGRRDVAVFHPDAANADAYDALYADYKVLHDCFGRGKRPLMHRLREIHDHAQEAASSGPAPARERSRI